MAVLAFAGVEPAINPTFPKWFSQSLLRGCPLALLCEPAFGLIQRPA